MKRDQHGRKAREQQAAPPPADDPPPLPPVRPGGDECCGQGCDPCVFDRYEAALERYRAELRAWQMRHGREGRG